MLTVIKGKERVRVFTFLTCKRCGGVYAYIDGHLKNHVKDIFKADEKIFEREDRCPNCKGKISYFELMDENYEKHAKSILITQDDNTRTLNDDEIYVYI